MLYLHRSVLLNLFFCVSAGMCVAIQHSAFFHYFSYNIRQAWCIHVMHLTNFSIFSLNFLYCFFYYFYVLQEMPQTIWCYPHTLLFICQTRTSKENALVWYACTFLIGELIQRIHYHISTCLFAQCSLEPSDNSLIFVLI